MIPAVDISKWSTPYKYYIFDWAEVARPSPNYADAGVFKGSGLGVLGQAETLPPVQVMGQCNFVESSLVSQIQAQLGVPDTGYFDDETCVAWHERFGEKPNAERLTGSIEASCGSALVPTCPILDERSAGAPWSTAAMIGAGGLVAALAILVMRR